MEFDAKDLRAAFGSFATGVTVITTANPAGGFSGLTANSFSSVSMDPPLVQFSLARNADCFDAFIESAGFAVNVLAADQVEISKRFASKGIDKFEGLQVTPCGLGAALLEGCVARFECRKVAVYEGGDHLILIGEVTHYDYDPERKPLMFLRGSYLED